MTVPQEQPGGRRRDAMTRCSECGQRVAPVAWAVQVRCADSRDDYVQYVRAATVSEAREQVARTLRGDKYVGTVERRFPPRRRR